MNIGDTLSSSVQNIVTHPLRSVMTLLAIVIGIFAVVVMFSSVYGIKTVIRQNVQEMGLDNSLRIYPDQPTPAGIRRGSPQPGMFTPTPRQPKPLDYEDYQLLKQHVEHKYLYGVVERWFNRTSFAGRDRVRLVATGHDFFNAKNYIVPAGRLFTHREMDGAARVCLLGKGLVNEYFPGEDVLGKKISLGDNLYMVVGVVDEQNTDGSVVFDFGAWERRRDLNSVYIPLTTGIVSLKPDKSVDHLVIRSSDEHSYRQMINRTRQVLLANHNMSQNFRFQDIGSYVADISQEMEEFMGKWNLTLTAIASVSLIVGGLGLFSTMLISIGERLLEIGIRKSVGASPSAIFSHFLVESLIFSLLGAAIAIAISTGLIKIVSILLQFSFPIVIEGIALGIGFALIVGILSGVYPALKAAGINPIEAIYYNE